MSDKVARSGPPRALQWKDGVRGQYPDAPTELADLGVIRGALARMRETFAKVKAEADGEWDYDVVAGRPATDADIAEIREAIGCPLPDDYIAFLREFGSLRLADVSDPEDVSEDDDRLSVLGTRRDDSAHWVVPIARSMHEEFEAAGTEPHAVTPFLLPRAYSTRDCFVFDTDGEVAIFRKGNVYPSHEGFQEVVAYHLAELAKQAERGDF